MNPAILRLLKHKSAGISLEDFITSLSPTFWYQADLGDISLLANDAAVGTWDDQSANALDATQGTAGAKPTYKTNILNGLPVVRFDGGDTMSKASVAGSLFSTNQGSTIVVALSSSATTVCGFGEWKSATTNVIEFFNASDVLSYDHGNVTIDQGRIRAAQPVGWDDNWHVHEAHRQTDGSGAIVIDGVSLTLQGTADTFSDDLDTAVSGTIRLGTATASGNMTGDVYLFVHFKTALTPGQLTTLRQLLEARTGINCSPFDLSLSSPSTVQIFQRSGSTGTITISGTVDA